MLNVALAEEGEADVLLALAQCSAVGPEALSVVGERILREGADVGRDPATPGEELEPVEGELDRLLVAHPNATRRAARRRAPPAREGRVLRPRRGVAPARDDRRRGARRALAGGVARCTIASGSRCSIPRRSRRSPRANGREDPSPLRREAVARIARDPALLAHSGEGSVATRAARGRLESLRAAISGPSSRPPIRAAKCARAPPGSLTAAQRGPRRSDRSPRRARFAAALRAMASGGVLAPDVVRALAGGAAELDDEGAMLAAQVLPRADLSALVEQVIGRGPSSSRAVSLAAGLALRPPARLRRDDGRRSGGRARRDRLRRGAVPLPRAAARTSRLTGKARLAAWAAEGLGACARRSIARASSASSRAGRSPPSA